MRDECVTCTCGAPETDCRAPVRAARLEGMLTVGVLLPLAGIIVALGWMIGVLIDFRVRERRRPETAARRPDGVMDHPEAVSAP